MPNWFWPTTSTIPMWVTPTAATTSATTTSWITPTNRIYSVTTSDNNTVWWSPQSQAATATTSAYHSMYIDPQALQLQTALAQQQAYQDHMAWEAAAPAIIHRDNDEVLYRRALAEHNDQEAARLLRQIEARAQSEAQRREMIAQQAQRSREDQQRRAAASERARELLFENLTPAQRDTVTRNGWFIIEGGRTKTKYRIRTTGGVAGNIDVLDRRDRTTHRLCCHAQSHIPPADQWLAQKIMLELAEDDFLRTANRHAA